MTGTALILGGFGIVWVVKIEVEGRVVHGLERGRRFLGSVRVEVEIMGRPIVMLVLVVGIWVLGAAETVSLEGRIGWVGIHDGRLMLAVPPEGLLL